MVELVFQNPVIVALVALIGFSLLASAILEIAAVRYKIKDNNIVDQVDNLLPQTQCGQCGYPGCKPYAQAIIDGDEINKCPPGGQKTINALADLLNVKALPLNPEHGEAPTEKKVAFIREAECIGCTKCILACPIDAILGAAKQMHTVIADECTGCDLCVDPCPVDCIEMIPAEKNIKDWNWDFPTQLIASDKLLPNEKAA